MRKTYIMIDSEHELPEDTMAFVFDDEAALAQARADSEHGIVFTYEGTTLRRID